MSNGARMADLFHEIIHISHTYEDQLAMSELMIGFVASVIAGMAKHNAERQEEMLAAFMGDVRATISLLNAVFALKKASLQ